MLRPLTTAIAALALAASPVEAAIIHPLNEQDPGASGFSTNNPTNATRGWRFLVNATDVYVHELGINSPGSATMPVTLTLFDVATQGVLAQVSTTPGPGWVFEPLPAPIPLVQGQQYIVAMYTGSPSSGYYLQSFTPPSSWFPTGDIQYLDMRFANGGGPSVYPTNVLSNWQYGVPDIGYTIGLQTEPAIPEPATLAVFAGVVGVGGLVARRRKHADPTRV